MNSSSVIKGHKCGIFLGNIDKDTFGVTVLVGFPYIYIFAVVFNSFLYLPFSLAIFIDLTVFYFVPWYI